MRVRERESELIMKITGNTANLGAVAASILLQNLEQQEKVTEKRQTETERKKDR